jgi:hypothetical protein
MSIVNYTRFRNRVLYPLSAVFFVLALYIAWFKSVYFYGQPVTLFVVLILIGAGFAVANFKPRS